MSKSIFVFGSEKSRWIVEPSFARGIFRYMSSSAKILISERQCFLTFSTRLFFLHHPFSHFTLARHRKLSRLLKGRRLARHRSAKGIFRLLLLHPLRRRPQKLKCKAIERWSTLIPASPLSHLFEEFRAKIGSNCEKVMQIG